MTLITPLLRRHFNTHKDQKQVVRTQTWASASKQIDMGRPSDQQTRTV